MTTTWDITRPASLEIGPVDPRHAADTSPCASGISSVAVNRPVYFTTMPFGQLLLDDPALPAFWRLSGSKSP